MATPDDDTQTAAPPPAASGGAPIDYGALAQQLMQAPPSVQPDTTPVKRGWLSLLGEALGGGHETAAMSPAQSESAGLRALTQFGTGLMAASRYQPGQTVFSNLAGGFQGAQQSERGSEELAVSQLAAQQNYQMEQQKLQMERLKTALPLLRMQAGANIPNLLAGTGAQPGTSTGSGGPATGGTYESAIGGMEGTGKNPNSSAAGTGAFLDSTWKDFAAANPDLFKGMTPQQILDARTDPNLGPVLGNKAITWLAQRNAGVLGNSSIAPTGQSLGIAHYVGPGAAASIMAAPDNAPVSSFVGADAVKANPELATMTVGQMKQRYANVPNPGFLKPPGSTTAAQPAVPAARPGGPPAVPAAPPGTIQGTPDTGGAQFAGPGAKGGAVTPPSAAVPGDVGAIIGGMKGAGAAPTTLAPGVAAAGPAAPTAVAAATPPPAQDTRPDSELTWEEFKARHGSPITPAQTAALTITPDPQLLQQAQSSMQTAAQNLRQARLSGNDDAANKAQADFEAARKNVADLKQQAAQDTATNIQKAQEAQDTLLSGQLAEARRLAATAAENDKNRQAAAALKTQEGQQAIELAKVNAGQTWHQKLQEQAAQDAQENTIKPMSAASAKAHQMNLGLSQMLPVLQDLPPSGGTLGTVLDAHPDLAPLFNQAGILNDRQADAVRLINGLVSSISTEMKPTGLGALREYEWDAFKAQLPSMLSTPGGQQKAVALLMNMNNRIQQEGSWMSSYYSRKIPDETTPGRMVPAHNLESDDPTQSVQQRMDRELGPIVPSYTGPMTGSAQAQWEQSLPPGKPYYKTYAVPDPKNAGQPLRDRTGNVVTTKSLEVRPWQ